MRLLDDALAAIDRADAPRVIGRVGALRGLTVLVDDLPLPAGALVSFSSGRGVRRDERGDALRGEVVGFTREHAVVMLLGQAGGLSPGDAVVGEESSPTALAGPRLLGRCVDGLGRPIDGAGPVRERTHVPLSPEPIPALRRRRITAQLLTGVRAIDLMTPLGRGQRLGIFAGPGVGKSTLLGMIARRTSADVNVIALIGERGREVRDFVEHALGPEGLARSVVVVATGDESPVMRLRAARLACSVAEFFRDAGRDVLLMMDSVTRFAHAQRQVGLANGEPPATKGYTPSVFAQLGLLLERAGAVESPGAPGAGGSVTGLYTILVEGDDMTEPVADASRGILDGHVVLSRRLAQRAHFPAIDVLDSVSRVADDIITPAHADARREVVRLLAAQREVEDLVQIGAYTRGTNPGTDIALDLHPRIIALLRQGRDEPAPFEKFRDELQRIAAEALAPRGARPASRAAAPTGAR
ncbi:MAG: FliI/YscN family ATPase [Planctomycetota bacterium]|nr:FliI/YscN family ATPase [Planctomycetota bacterium]